MRKEVLFIIIFGIVFGLVIAFGVFRINTKIEKNGKNQTEQKQNETAEKPSEFKIALVKPENEDVVTEETVVVSGLTKSLSFIAVSGEEKDYITQADEKGQFEAEVDLVGGNQIKVAAFDPEGKDSYQKVLVVYSSAFEKRTAEEDKTETSSDEAGIREKVQAKVEEVLNKPKAYLGTVTDITEGSIQIKSDSSEIRQVSALSDSLTVINSLLKNKEVKLEDIAIGDYIVAMGYPTGAGGKSATQVLNAQRTLIISPVKDPETTHAIAKVVSSTAKELTVDVLGDAEEEKITPTKTTLFTSFDKGKTAKIKIADIDDESLIITVFAKDAKDALFPRSIFLLTKS